MTLLIHTKNFAVSMDDAIADHYSRPHPSGGIYKQIGVKHGQPVPLHKTIKESYLERSSGRDANTLEKGYVKIASQARQAHQGKRKHSDSDREDDGESKKNINRKKKKKTKKLSKHKRNRIDDALGDNTY